VGDERPFVRLHLDEIETLPAAGTLGWKPVRRHLGIQAFGMNAWTAREAGDEVVEDHDETGGGAGGHEEVYLVLSGRARFTVAGDELDAPAGTFVFVRDPTVRRHAVAAEANTTVLAVGGQPGRAYAVSPWEYSFYAVPRAETDVEDAISIMHDGLKAYPENGSLLYNLACFESKAGRAEAAAAHLRRALELDPELARYVPDDSDLDPIRDHPEFPRRQPA
jgi:tetratricopeptide (TPR) repeat protein